MGHRPLVVNGLTSLPSVVVETAERKTQSEQSRDPPHPVLAPTQGVSPPKLWPQMWRWGSPGNVLRTEEEEEEKRGVYWEELGPPRDRLVEAEMLNGSALPEAPYSLHPLSKFALGPSPAGLSACKELVPALTTLVFPWLGWPCPQRSDPSDRLHCTPLLCSSAWLYLWRPSLR